MTDKTALRDQAIRLRAQGKSRREIGELLGLRHDSAVGRLLVGTEALPALRRARAKDAERDRARELRAQGWTYQQIAAEQGVSTSSCSLWLRHMPHPVFERHLDGDRWHASWAPVLRRRAADRQQTKLAAAIEMLPLSRRDIILAGAVAYWCEGTKAKVWRKRERLTFVNSDPHLIELFLRFLEAVGVEPHRRGFRVSIHESADLAEAVEYWAAVVGVAPETFAPGHDQAQPSRTNRLNQAES
jgi:predicted transcriptional regulator